jgi:hypothetical protein
MGVNWLLQKIVQRHAVYPKQARCGSVKGEADMREVFKFKETLYEDTPENKD